MVVTDSTVITPTPVPKAKTFFQKYFTKTALIVGLVILSSIGIWVAVNQHSKLTQARAELSTNNVYIGIVEQEKNRLDSLARAYSGQIKDRDAVIVEKDKKIALGWHVIGSLQDSLKNTLINLSAVNADSSYKYINTRIPALSPLRYPFDSTQVKTIHYTFLERDGLFNINVKQTTLLTDLNLLSTLKDSQISDLRNLNSTYQSMNSICKKENSAYTTEIAGLNKVVKQQKFLKNVLIAPAAVGVIMVAIKLIAK